MKIDLLTSTSSRPNKRVKLNSLLKSKRCAVARAEGCLGERSRAGRSRGSEVAEGVVRTRRGRIHLLDGGLLPTHLADMIHIGLVRSPIA